MSDKSKKTVKTVEVKEQQKGKYEVTRVVTNKAGKQVTQYRCTYCGKWINRDTSIEDECGDYCKDLHETQGYSDEALLNHRKSLSVDNVPVAEDGTLYIKVAVLDRMLKKLGIPVSRMVNAFGRDRSINGPLHPKFQVFYVGNARYLHPWCGSEEGLNYLRGLGPTKKAGSTRAETPKTGEVMAIAEALDQPTEIWGEEQEESEQ